ncbi:MAG: PAS domain-containing sensor histidine kinase [Bacteroidetes bacterium]|nr:MAG: PAS domain-containing sensor histidine kinase [Bacteroidota bacterium]
MPFSITIFSLVCVVHFGFLTKPVSAQGFADFKVYLTHENFQYISDLPSESFTAGLAVSSSQFVNLFTLLETPPAGFMLDSTFYYTSLIFFISLLIAGLIVINFFWLKSLRTSKSSQRSQRKLKMILESSPSALMIFQEYKLIYVNSAFESLTGYTRKELLSMEIWEIFHPESLRKLNTDEIMVVRDGHNFRGEFEIITKFNKTKWIDFSTRSLDLEGKTAILATAIDINEKKNFEKQLIETEERYSNIVNATNDGISDYDIAKQELYLSLQWMEILGFGEDEPESKLSSWLSLVHQEEKPKIMKIMDNLENGNFHSFRTEYRIKGKDNKYKWISASFTTIKDKNGKPLRILGAHADITERKETESRLRESELRYKSFFSKNSAVMLIVDPQSGKIQDANRAAINYYGYNKETLLSMNISDITARTAEQKETETESASHENRPFYYLQHKLQDGSIKDVEVYKSDIKIREKTLQVFIIFDITRRKKMEQELHTAKELAEEANRVKSFFVSTVSHEIRTPLNSIIGLTNLLIDEENLSPQQMENLKSIKYSSDHLLDVINDVLDFSKLEAGKVQLEETDFDLTNLIRESTKTIEFKAREKDIEIKVKIDQDIPKVLLGDPSRLKQILLNLLSNAVKFTSHGHIDIEAKVLKIENDRSEIKFSVSDTGIGIAEERLSGIFDSFSQASSDTTPIFGGTGLGLSICKKLVELLNGKIGIKSMEGMGSTFWVEIPFKISQRPYLTELDKPGGKLNNLKGIHILLVEDDKMNQFVMSQLLKKWFAKLDIAENGKKAIEKLKKNSYDLVLMDLHIPELDGFEATQIIRNKDSEVINHDTPIIALTADVTAETREKAKQAGMNDFITKPSEPKVMFEKIMKAVINQKKEFVEKKETEEKSEEKPLRKDKEILKEKVRFALAGIFEDDLESTLALISRFLKEIPRTLISVNEAFYDKDFDNLNRLVHKIKPSFAYMGFKELTELINHIQDLAKEGKEFSGLEDLIKKLDNESREIIALLREIQKDFLRNNSIDIQSRRE